MSEVTLPAKVELTPEILAATFGNWDANLQALFFVRLVEYTESWGHMDRQTQMLAIGSALRGRKDSGLVAVISEMLEDIRGGIVDNE